MTMTREEFYATLADAIELGYVTPIMCVTHEGIQWSEGEEAELEQGFDPCAHVVRLWEQG